MKATAKFDLDQVLNKASVENYNSNREDQDQDSFILTDSSVITDRNFEYEIPDHLYATARNNKASPLDDDHHSWCKSEDREIRENAQPHNFEQSDKVTEFG